MRKVIASRVIMSVPFKGSILSSDLSDFAAKAVEIVGQACSDLGLSDRSRSVTYTERMKIIENSVQEESGSRGFDCYV